MFAKPLGRDHWLIFYLLKNAGSLCRTAIMFKMTPDVYSLTAYSKEKRRREKKGLSVNLEQGTLIQVTASQPEAQPAVM